MSRDERDQLKALVDEALDLAGAAEEIVTGRDQAKRIVRDDIERLSARAVQVAREGRTAWRVVPLSQDDADIPSHLAAVRDLPPISAPERTSLDWLHGSFRDTAESATPMIKARFFVGRKKLESARTAAAAVPDLIEQARQSGVRDVLAKLAPPPPADPEPSMGDILDRSLNFAAVLGGQPSSTELLHRVEFERLYDAIGILDYAVAAEKRHVEAAKAAGDRVRAGDVRRLVEAMPLDALRPMTREQINLKPFRAAGVANVQMLLDHASGLERIPGVGRATARRAVGAGTQLLQITREDTPVRIDVQQRSGDTTALLKALRAWDGSRRTRGAALDLARADELRALGRTLSPSATHAIVIPVDSTPVDVLRTSISAVERRADLVQGTTAAGVDDGDVWEDFLGRPSDYFGLLAELGFATEDTKKAHGDLPEEIIEAVRAQELLTDNIKASLRGYQSFAARFAIVQEKVIIGDEMGLGKTVEALAVLAHLRSKGEHHFLVICPAAVVSNWVRETHHHTTLRAHRLHGPADQRRIALRNWRRTGGVAVTTFDLFAGAFESLRTEVDRLVSCVVVDEAHYVKNPRTKRANYTSAAIAAAPRAVLMSGTPLENRVEEFRNIVSYIRPDLARAASEYSAVQFRRQVAPVYLRRNQEDVLTELPELVEVDEWLGMSAADEARYRAAVIDGNFAAMRRAAMLSQDSEKLARLREVVNEAEANERRVIVYSYFLDVLDLISVALPGNVFGPLTGKVPAPKRQQMVDEFSTAQHGAALVSQIVAGGVGLNIQAASVIVICEPQLKPTTESQAIARAHRMGQVHSVQVHRLLSEGSVDERVREILARKRAMFDEFARISDTADAAPEAVDISDAEIAREVVTAERLRVLGAGRDSAPEAIAPSAE
jgi:hypothetical protein